MDTTEVNKTFKGMIDAAKDYTKPLEDAGDEMLAIYGDKVFQQQGSQGLKWKELSASTLMMRENRTGYYAQPPVQTGKILIWTGRLMGGFQKRAERLKLTINNTVDYFKYQQKKRKMLYINKDIIDIVAQKVIQHTNDSMK